MYISSAMPIRPSPAPDWRAIDWPAHEHTARVGGGVVSYASIGAGDPAVVFIHGLGGQWRNWLENLPAVAEHRRAIAVDLPGFGGSEMPLEKVSISGYAQAVDELCERLDLGPIVAVGNSMGGFVTAELALLRPERVERLVLVDAAGIVPTRGERLKARPALWAAAVLGARLAMANRHLASRPRLRRGVLRLSAHDPRRLKADLVFHGLLEGDRPAMRPALKASFSYISHQWGDDLKRITCPTAVVWGEADALIPVRHADEFVRLIPGARAIRIESAGHLPMLEQPAAFNRALIDFIES
jgi:pimeloyl-ACP methyl ester carboxylesterase